MKAEGCHLEEPSYEYEKDGPEGERVSRNRGHILDVEAAAREVDDQDAREKEERSHMIPDEVHQCDSLLIDITEEPYQEVGWDEDELDEDVEFNQVR